MAEAFQQTAQCGGLAENKKTSQAGGLLVCGNNVDKNLFGMIKNSINKLLNRTCSSIAPQGRISQGVTYRPTGSRCLRPVGRSNIVPEK